MKPLYDGGIPKIGDLVKWVEPGPKAYIEPFGQGPFLVSHTYLNNFFLVNQHGKGFWIVGLNWLVPAKSLLTAILEAMNQIIPYALGFVSPVETVETTAEKDIQMIGSILLAADLTKEEKSQAVKRLGEMIKLFSPYSGARYYLEELIAALQKR